MIKWIVFGSLYLALGACVSYYPQGEAINSEGKEGYLRALNAKTRQTKLYKSFNTIMVANATLFNQKFYNYFKRFQMKHGARAAEKGELVIQDKNELFAHYLDGKSLLVLLSVYAPTPHRYLAEDFTAHWLLTASSEKLNKVVSDQLRAKVIPIRNIPKEVLQTYFPYVSRWSSEYLLRLSPRVGSKVSLFKMQELGLLLQSQVGKLNFYWTSETPKPE